MPRSNDTFRSSRAINFNKIATALTDSVHNTTAGLYPKPYSTHTMYI